MSDEIRHIIEAQQFDKEFLEKIFEYADFFRDEITKKNGYCLGHWEHSLEGRCMLLLFYEPSTRTRFSFTMAGCRLGMQTCWTENAGEFSSAAKGETLEDTIQVLCEYRPQVIILRHHEMGAAARAAAVSSVPIINAGDGPGQHPTQALLDLYTIRRAFGKSMDRQLTVAMIGDLANGRTVHSLSYLLAKHGGDIRLVFVSPRELAMREDILEWLLGKRVPFCIHHSLRPVLPHANVFYLTRIQKERGSSISDSERAKFRIGPEEVALMKEDAIIMHPLPRNDEISPNVDIDPRAWYFRQAGNGLFIRMALLLWVLRII